MVEPFDPKKNAEEISALEEDIQRIQKKLQDTETALKVNEQPYNDKKAKYLTEKGKLEDLQKAKERVSDQINGLMFAFEESKMQKLGLFADFLRIKYRKKFAVSFNHGEGEKSKGARIV